MSDQTISMGGSVHATDPGDFHIQTARNRVKLERDNLREALSEDADYRISGCKDLTEWYLCRVGYLFYRTVSWMDTGLEWHLKRKDKALNDLAYWEQELRNREAQFSKGKEFVDRVNFAQEYLRMSPEEKVAFRKEKGLDKKG